MGLDRWEVGFFCSLGVVVSRCVGLVEAFVCGSSLVVCCVYVLSLVVVVLPSVWWVFISWVVVGCGMWASLGVVPVLFLRGVVASSF